MDVNQVCLTEWLVSKSVVYVKRPWLRHSRGTCWALWMILVFLLVSPKIKTPSFWTSPSLICHPLILCVTEITEIVSIYAISHLNNTSECFMFFYFVTRMTEWFFITEKKSLHVLSLHANMLIRSSRAAVFSRAQLIPTQADRLTQMCPWRRRRRAAGRRGSSRPLSSSRGQRSVRLLSTLAQKTTAALLPDPPL